MQASADFAYTSQDVAEALARLSSVVAARGLQITVGSPSSPEDLQARWQAVATAPVMDQAPLDQLGAIYSHVEAVILSCGTPDTFDVYEVCFETMCKLGFVMQGSGRLYLVQVLTNVHEVYDVLLSCVETYEWVQPGATGSLRLWMLQVLFACFGSQQISGRDLMELTDNDVCGAVSLIAFLLKCGQAPFEMQATAGRCLVNLTTADSVFLDVAGEAANPDSQNEQISKLTGMLNRHVNGLIKGIIQFEIVEAFGRCICQHQMSHARTDIVVKNFLTTIHNCLLYCSENQKKLRQHLATQSTIMQDIMIPYVHNILPALYDNPAAGPSFIEWQNLKAALQTFVVTTFNITLFRPQIRDSDMIPRICQVPNVLSHISMIELLVKLCINVDFTKGPYYADILSLLQGAFNALPADSQVRLRRRLTSENSMRLPFAKSSIAATEALVFALTPLAGEEQPVAKPKPMGMAKKKPFAMQQGDDSKENVQPSSADAGDDSDYDDMPPLIPAEPYEPVLGAADQAGVPSKAVCQLSGAMMTDPVVSPEGHLFDRAALEDWTQFYPSNPVSGTPLTMAECSDAGEIKNYIQGFQMQTLSANAVVEKATPGTAQPSLLGDLPDLNGQQAAPKKKEKGKIKIESRSVIDCPDDMRCAVDGKVMINPVRSPYGHMFEKKTLERWMANCGSVCPITGQTLRLEDCQTDAETKKRIVKFLKGQA